ncbi:MAG: DEAD/DEAH box helicase [Pseudomonadales bacterium]
MRKPPAEQPANPKNDDRAEASPANDSNFRDLELPDALLTALAGLGYETPTPIQAKTIPALLAGRDLIGQAQTGTGKTAAFALPLLARLDPAINAPQVLVLAPTRELAIQVAEAFRDYARNLPQVEVLPIYGGQDYGVQLRALKRGPAIIVGTPGRVMDHIERGSLDLSGLSALVLDEADEMLRMGFIDDVEWILGHTPPARQLALFSATLPPEIRHIARSHLRDPLEIRLETRSAAASTVLQRVWLVDRVHKLDALTRILEVETFDAAIVFVRTRHSTVMLAEQLSARGFNADALHGEIPQNQRERIIERLREGGLDILVATDVAARGLDVERVSHVINYDMPYDTEAYVHRIGRTGRAGRTGTAILFAAPRERHMLRAIERATGREIEPISLPTPAELEEVRTLRFFTSLDQVIESGRLEFAQAIVERYVTERGVDAATFAAALTHLVRPPFAENKATNTARAQDTSTQTRPEPTPPRSPPRSRASDRRDDGDTKPERRSERRTRPSDETFDLFRIEVGREHGVEPRNIVGAIANEAGLDARHIGRIELHDEHSTIELPPGMPKPVFEHLKRVWISGRQLKLTRLNTATDINARPPRTPRRKTKQSASV